tara:strand:+ start:3317 stop:4201 length:885 start_codon:yes stop_codon:yes gene_type:complete
MPVDSNISNFSKKVDIKARDIDLHLDSNNSEIESNIPQSLHGTLDLTSYPLPENSEITMYVYYNKANSEISHPLGKVSEFNGDIGPVSLTDIDFITENENIYTLKVDIYISDKNTWKVDGSIRNITLKFPNTGDSSQTTERQINLIGLSRSNDLGEIPWKLDLINEEDPILLINDDGPQHQDYKDKIAFDLITLCEIHRQLTEYVITNSNAREIVMSEMTNWKVHFIHQLASLLDKDLLDMQNQLAEAYLTYINANEQDSELKDTLIDTSVEKFANKIQATTLINRFIGQLEED